VDTAGRDSQSCFEIFSFLCLHRLLDAFRALVAERRVAAAVLEALDPVEDHQPRLVAAAEGVPVEELGLEAKKLPATALSTSTRSPQS
jgi:hypothetical protein